MMTTRSCASAPGLATCDSDTARSPSRSRTPTMHRFPDGLEGEDFIQKDVPEYFPDWIKTVTVQSQRAHACLAVMKPSSARTICSGSSVTRGTAARRRRARW